MNPDLSNLSRDELEVKLTALLLGELEPVEAAALRERLAADPELAQLHARLAQTLGLVRAAVAQPGENVAPMTPLPRMSEERREQLLAQLREPAVPKAVPDAPEAKVIPVHFESTPSSLPMGNIALAIAACLVAAMGASLLLPSLAKAKSKSMASTRYGLEMNRGGQAESGDRAAQGRGGANSVTDGDGTSPASTPLSDRTPHSPLPTPVRRDASPALTPLSAAVDAPAPVNSPTAAPEPAVDQLSERLRKKSEAVPKPANSTLATRFYRVDPKGLGTAVPGGAPAGNNIIAGGAGGGGFGGGAGGGAVAVAGGLPAGPVNAPAAPAPAMEPQLMRRYGLAPAEAKPAATDFSGVAPAPGTAQSVELGVTAVPAPSLNLPEARDARAKTEWFFDSPPPGSTDGNKAGATAGADPQQNLFGGVAGRAGVPGVPPALPSLAFGVQEGALEKGKANVGQGTTETAFNFDTGPRGSAGSSIGAGSGPRAAAPVADFKRAEDLSRQSRRLGEVADGLAPNFRAPAATASASSATATPPADKAAAVAPVVVTGSRIAGEDFSLARKVVAADDSVRDLSRKDSPAIVLADRENDGSTVSFAKELADVKVLVDDGRKLTVAVTNGPAGALASNRGLLFEGLEEKKVTAHFAEQAPAPVASEAAGVAFSADARGVNGSLAGLPALRQQIESESLAQLKRPEMVEAGKPVRLVIAGDKLEIAAAPAIPPPVPQPEVSTADNAFSTFSLNVSDVSFKLAGATLEQGSLPAPGSIRTEEFINAFQYRDPDPAPGVPVAFASEIAHYPFAHNREVLRFAVRTAARGREAGRPLNLVLAIDNSGSMERADRVRTLREALRTLAAQLQPNDQVSVVSFSRVARLWVDGLPGNRANELLDAVVNLTPEGGTNLEDALRVAYETALRHFVANGVNRVVMLTDGAANLGDVSPDSLKRNVESYRRRGIALDCFGIGWEGYNDTLLETLSRNGDGRYGFVNTPEEAGPGFAAQLAGALQVAASDVKVQVEFNPRRVTSWRQVGYAQHQLTKEQFRDNTVDAAEIGAAESGNALYVLELNPKGEGPVATARVRYKLPSTGVVEEHEWSVPYTGVPVPLDQASPAMRLATTSASFAESLAQSPYAGDVTAPRLLEFMAGVAAAFAPDPRPAQLDTMIRQTGTLRGN